MLSQTVTLEELIREIEEKIRDVGATTEELSELFKAAERQLDRYKAKLRDLAELAKRMRKEVKLSDSFKRYSSEVLINTMRTVAWRYLKMEGTEAEHFRKSFEGQAFRLLEQVRAGKREEAQYLILRTLIASGVEIDDRLLKAFSPALSDKEFRAAMFTFIGEMLRGIHRDEKEG